MKKLFLLLALVAVAFLVSSCKNKKQKKADEAAVEVTKIILADEVLETLDSLTKEIALNAESEKLMQVEVSGDQKLVKPNYLYNPADANKLVTLDQKIGAMAILYPEYFVRKAYDMPVDECEKMLLKLSSEVNYSLDTAKLKKNIPISEIIMEEYDDCKKNGTIANFWKYQVDVALEMRYLMASNPDFYFDKMTQDELESLVVKCRDIVQSLELLSEYDEEMKEVYDLFTSCKILEQNKDIPTTIPTVADVRKLYKDNKKKIIKARNSLVK